MKNIIDGGLNTTSQHYTPKFGMVEGCPSLVSSDGKPFLWDNQELIVKDISPKGDRAKILVSGVIEKDTIIHWNNDGPVVIEGYIIEDDRSGSSFEEDEEDGHNEFSFDGTHASQIQCIRNDGKSFWINNVKFPIIKDKSGISYSTKREEGDRRLVIPIGNNSKSTYFAVRKQEKWNVIVSSSFRGKEDTNSAVVCPVKFPLSSGYVFSEDGKLLQYDDSNYNFEGPYRNGDPSSCLKIIQNITTINGLTIERVEQEREAWVEKEMSQSCIFTGKYNFKVIRFYLDISSGSIDVPYKEINGEIIFYTPAGNILWPESLKNHSIVLEKEPIHIRGFLGKNFYELTNNDKDQCTYTDGKNLYSFKKVDGKMATYENLDSQYDGYPIAMDSLNNGRYGAFFSGEFGKEYVKIATSNGTKLISLMAKDSSKGSREVIISPVHRNEVKTNHTKALEDGYKIVGFHPKSGIIILAPKNDYTTSFYRYYGIGSDGELSYLGSKNNIIISDRGESAEFVSQAGNNSQNSGITQKILLGNQNESRAFMVGDITFLPIFTDDEKGYLLQLMSDESRELVSLDQNRITIPPEWIIDGKLSENANLYSLLQFFPETDVLFIPDNYSFIDIKGISVKVENVADIPKIGFGEDFYYLLDEGDHDLIKIWNPKKNITMEIPLFHDNSIYNSANGWHSNDASGLIVASNGMYVYPANSELPDGIRLVLFTGIDNQPTLSYMWYDGTKNTVAYFTDTNQNPIISQELSSNNDSIVFIKTNNGICVFNVMNQSIIDIPKYNGLSPGIKKDQSIGYFIGRQEVKCDNQNKPRQIYVNGDLWYVVSEDSIPDWSTNFQEDVTRKDVSVVHGYLPSENIFASFTLQNDVYIPLITLPSRDKYLKVTPNDIQVGDSLNEGQNWVHSWDLIALGRLPEEHTNSIVLHDIIYPYGKYAIAYGRTIPGLFKGTESDKDLSCAVYLIHKLGNNTQCFSLGENISITGNGIIIDGVEYNIRTDSKILNLWMEHLLEKYIVKGCTTENLVSSKKGTVGNLLNQ